jgi:hypothetical protein
MTLYMYAHMYLDPTSNKLVMNTHKAGPDTF